MNKSINQRVLDEILDKEISEEGGLDIEQEAFFFLKSRGILIEELQRATEKNPE